MGPDTLLNQREIQKIVHVNDLVSQLLRTFRFEERRQLTYDRFNKYPTDVRVRKDLVERVLGPLEEPLDKGTMVQLLKQLGPVGGPHLGVVTLEWMLESGWEEARSVHVFNALLALCDRCCQNKEVAFTVSVNLYLWESETKQPRIQVIFQCPTMTHITTRLFVY